MIENKKKKYTMTLFILIAIATFATMLSIFMVSGMQQVSKNAISKWNATSDKAPIQVIGEMKVSHSDVGTAGIEITKFTSLFTADEAGKELYCINHGVEFSHSSVDRLRISEALNYGGLDGSIKVWPTTHKICSLKDDTNIRENRTDDLYTLPFLQCVGKHYNLLDKTGEYHPDVAYILTYPQLGKWSEEKQNALWCTAFSAARSPKKTGEGPGVAIYLEAVKFREFSDRTTSVAGATQTEPDIDAQDHTNMDRMQIMPNYNDQTYILGPFSIDYINGIYENIAFGGISDMYFIGYNKDGKRIRNRIEVEKYIYEGKEYDLQYFEPEVRNYSYVDNTPQVYPKGRSAGEEEFYLKIKNPNTNIKNSNNIVNGVSLHIDFEWMGVTSANICELDAHKYQVHGAHTHQWHCHGHSRKNGTYYCNGCCYYCTWSTHLEEKDIQDHINVLEAERKLFRTSLEIPGRTEEIELHLERSIKILMELGGHVWEDSLAGKGNIAEGFSNTVDNNGEAMDMPLKNVKVTLYSCKKGDKIGDGIIEELSIPENIAQDEVIHYVNPTLTDEKGNYLFKNLDPLKKYYVTFEYNGQVYLPTEYLSTGETHEDAEGHTVVEHYQSVQEMVNAGLYNTTQWEITSKGTEVPEKVRAEEIKDRNTYNEQFEEIRSYPENYETSNSLRRSGRYNTTFTQKELMGYELNRDGHYVQTGIQLVDGFLYDENGLETKTYAQGEISTRIREYITRYHEYPDENAMRSEIYRQIAREDEEIWKKLQFIEDCKMSSYTQAQGGELDLYPVYDAFVYNSRQTYEQYELGLNIYITEEITIEGIDYQLIYPGQYYINQGLWRRQLNDLALRKDVYRVATKINGKTEVYQYNKRNPDSENEGEDYWQIHLRMQDYENYYQGNYNRELYRSDYEYKGENGGEPLEIYVTYKLTIRNASQGILNEVTEVVDYYDKEYTYMPNLSWVMYKDSNQDDNTKVAVSNSSYYNMMHHLSLNQIPNAREIASSPNTQSSGTGNSRYGDSTKQDMERNYNSVYVRGLENKKIATGENVYVYLTFKVNADEKGPVILDEVNSPKMNYAEINGYTNYYENGTVLPNYQIIRGENTPAGLIDHNSTPGNLQLKDLEGEKYEKNFENDTDRAKGIQIIIDPQADRTINGIVWEDQRTEIVNEAVIGDGIRQNGEIGIQGVKVQLVEKLEGGKEYIWDKLETTTNQEGNYEIKGYIPGNYVVRFNYGNEDATVLTKTNGGLNAVSYNGQDFKSTVYLKNLQNGLELDEKDGYYDITMADQNTAKGNHYSDAKDNWNDREKVNSYSNNQGKGVTNYLAEVLAAPYAKNINQEHIKELKQNTSMKADTAIIVAEVEYHRQNTGNLEAIGGTYYNDNHKNGNYTFHSIDFGLTERPKAQLEINKKVSNVKITLANGNILFDANKTVDGMVWQAGTPYNLASKMTKNKYKEYYEESKEDTRYHRYSYQAEIDKLIQENFAGGSNGFVQPHIDDELMHGANIEISYELEVKNVGETDYTGQDFYYKAVGSNEANKVTTTANEVIDYVANNLKYAQNNNNQAWKMVTTSNITNQQAEKERLVNSSLQEKVARFNTILTTTSLAGNLKPGQTAKANLTLSQLMTSQNTDDDRTYNNITEIVKTSNTVGRRMAYSIVGNQDPTENPTEVDSSRAEEVSVLPPYGSNYLTYLGVGILAMSLLAGGVFLIKKKMSSRDIG